MITQQQISDFLANDPIALAGASKNKKKFGFTAFKELTDKGLNLIPVNPNADEIYGVKVVQEIKDLPNKVNALLVMTKKDQTLSVVQEAKEKGIKHIWIQQMSETPEAIEEFKGTDVNLISKQCVLMFHEPRSIHKFHRNIKRLFGRLPR